MEQHARKPWRPRPRPRRESTQSHGQRATNLARAIRWTIAYQTPAGADNRLNETAVTSGGVVGQR
eukprot:3901476-Lingulodinium_polyedra.AAC.1